MAGKANSIKLFSFDTPQMRAFHLTWVAFFVCFFAWFACAPLMPVIKGEFHLSVSQIADINIAAVAITIIVRLIVGPLCDRFGPRKTYTGLLALGAIPVLGVAAAQSYESFLLVLPQQFTTIRAPVARRRGSLSRTKASTPMF